MSKGGTTSSNTQIPAYLEDAVRENINRARDVSQIGYTPYYGADVAAFSPMQQQSMLSTGNAASAFGLAPQGFDAMAGMPQAQTFAGGVQGYSSAPLYEQSLDNLFANAPAQYNAMSDMFIDPFTGARSRNNYGNASPVAMTGGGNGNSPYGNDANIDHLNRMKEQGAADVYDSIYRQNMSGDLVRGDTFVGDDGLNYTVGYDVGQVDPGLANAVQRNKINEVRSTGSAIGSIIGNTLQGGLLGRGIEALTGVAPFNSNDAPRGSLSSVDVRDGRFGGLIGYEQENARAQYDQRGDMYPSQIESGLLNGTPLASSNIVDLSAARQAEDLAAQQRAAQRIAEERAQSALAVQYANEQALAAQRMAAEKAAQLAHEQAMIAAQRSTVNGGGDGEGARQRSSGGYGKSQAPGEAGSRFGL